MDDMKESGENQPQEVTEKKCRHRCGDHGAENDSPRGARWNVYRNGQRSHPSKWRMGKSVGAGFPVHPWFHRNMTSPGPGMGQGPASNEPRMFPGCKFHIRLRRREDAAGKHSPPPHRCGRGGNGRGWGGQRQCWFEVVCMPRLVKEGASVKIEETKVIITGPRMSRGDLKEPEPDKNGQVNRQVQLPDDVARRTIRCVWLGPHRLFIFALKKRHTTDNQDTTSEAAETKSTTEPQGRGKEERRRWRRGRRECWFQMVHLPEVTKDDVTVEMKPRKVFVKKSKQEAGPGQDKPMREVALPDDIARSTLNVTWFGPHRLCLFALKKPQKTEEGTDEKLPGAGAEGNTKSSLSDGETSGNEAQNEADPDKLAGVTLRPVGDLGPLDTVEDDELAGDYEEVMTFDAQNEPTAEGAAPGTSCPQLQAGVHGRRGACKRQSWSQVVRFERDGAEIKIGKTEIQLTGTSKVKEDREAQEDDSKEQLKRSVEIPDDVAARTIRCVWLGPHRLFIFALKKRNNAQDEEKPALKPTRGRRGCRGRREGWFQIVHLPGIGQDDVKVDVKPKKVLVKHSDPQESGPEPIKTVTLPEDIARPTLNVTWFGPHRLCVFALKKPGKKVDGDVNDMPQEREDPPQLSEEPKSSIRDASEDDEDDVILEAALDSLRMTDEVRCDEDEMEHTEVEADEDWIKPDEEMTKELTQSAQEKTLLGSVTSLSASSSGFQLDMDVSGYQAQEVQVKLEGRTLHVSAHHVEEAGPDVTEYQFRRQQSLPDNVDTAHLKITLDQATGLLHITAPTVDPTSSSLSWSVPIEFV